MRAHYLQHVPFEGLGSIEAWLKNANYKVTSTKFYESSTLPKIEDIDLLIVMGGPMSVNDEEGHPWLKHEKQFIKEAIIAGKATLGICLGAQLIADTMGGNIFKNPNKEIGWYSIQSTPENKTTFKFPREIDVFHWHGETFTLPQNAIRIAENEVCSNQAFQISNHVIGLQFHLEVTNSSVKKMIENCGQELVIGEYIQQEHEIMSKSDKYYETVNNLMNNILDFLHEKNG